MLEKEKLGKERRRERKADHVKRRKDAGEREERCWRKREAEIMEKQRKYDGEREKENYRERVKKKCWRKRDGEMLE